MVKETVWVCSYCNEEFDKKEECREHEKECKESRGVKAFGEEALQHLKAIRSYLGWILAIIIISIIIAIFSGCVSFMNSIGK